MKKLPNKIPPTVHSLGDLVQLVSSCSRSQSATVAAVADLLDRGRIRFQSRGQKLRVRVS